MVNISSLAGPGGNAGQANYSSAKAGVTGLTKALAKEWGRYNVTVNTVAFGLIKTRLTETPADGDGTIDVAGKEIKVGVNPGLLAAMEQMVPSDAAAPRPKPRARCTCSASPNPTTSARRPWSAAAASASRRVVTATATATAYRSSWADEDVIALKDMATKFFRDRSFTPPRTLGGAEMCRPRVLVQGWGTRSVVWVRPGGVWRRWRTLAHDFAVFEAQAACGETGFGNQVHSGLVAHYILTYGTEEQKRRWLPGMATGELIGAIAMTEPGGGSDLKALRTTAIRDGDHYRLNGAKTFISNGSTART